MIPRPVDSELEEAQLALFPRGTHLTNAIFGSAAPRRRAPSNPRPAPREGSSMPATVPATKSSMPRASPVTPPKRSFVRTANLERRPASPDLATIIAMTPRPRRTSSTPSSPASRLLSRAQSFYAAPSSWKAKPDDMRDDVSVNTDYGTILDHIQPEMDPDEEDRLEKELEGDGSESDSSIDLHTPLPHLMFRDGLLSPRSKLLPQVVTPSTFDDLDIAVDGDRSQSVLSVASTMGSTKTKSGFFKDPRDTQRRKVRHRDGRLLRAGMGLTTGLGWSDSEDEDAPSTLTRRLIHTSIAKGPPLSPISSRLSSQLAGAATTAQAGASPIQRPFLRKEPLTRSASTSFSWIRPDVSGSITSIEQGRSVRARAQSTASADTASIYSMASLARTPPIDSSEPSVSTRSRTMSSASASSMSTSATSSVPMPQMAIADKSRSNGANVPPSSMRRPILMNSQESSVPRSRSRTSSGTSTGSGSVGPAVSRTGAVNGVKSRRRTQSSASTSSTPIASTVSGGSSTGSASRTPVQTQHKLPETASPATIPRTRSLASSASTRSSTRSSSSSVSVPRPLRLPQSTGVLPDTPRSPTSPAPKALLPSSSSIPAERPRARTLSSSESVSLLSKVAPPSTVSVNPASTLALQRSVSTMMRGSTSPPPLPGHRARPSLTGPRPKPRTGTGMAYRTTSSYSSLQATVMSMHSVSPSADAGVMI